MSKALVTEQYLTDTAAAIRTKLGTSDTYTPSEFATAIGSISNGATTHTVSVSEEAIAQGVRVSLIIPTLINQATETELHVPAGYMFFTNQNSQGIDTDSVTSGGSTLSARECSSFTQAYWSGYVMPDADVEVTWSSFEDEIPPEIPPDL